MQKQFGINTEQFKCRDASAGGQVMYALLKDNFKFKLKLNCRIPQFVGSKNLQNFNLVAHDAYKHIVLLMATTED